jgi:hypothetical protein
VNKNERIGMKAREWVESDIFTRANILAQLTWENALPFLFFCSISGIDRFNHTKNTYLCVSCLRWLTVKICFFFQSSADIKNEYFLYRLKLLANKKNKSPFL